MRPLLFFIAAAGTVLAGNGNELRIWRSGAASVPLLELFTSEGCSSCPPAERWLGELRNHPGLWREFVPVAWHVNYWDRLGWPDPYASAEFTQRQYAYASAWRAGTVYTPGFVRGGQEWKVREGGLTEPGLSKGGNLVAELENGNMRIHYDSPIDLGRSLKVHVARLGGGLESRVKAGENRGRTLEHEFVVLDWQTHPLREGRAEFAFPLEPESSPASRQSVAIWVSMDGVPTPLQATGGWLTPFEVE
jgi:hypothetical protein